ncbi:hypothetical protein NQ314_005907 [Rhamnusium bicolor]|uniref:Fatty acyl-CoA reductase n=1 Tax=Rhamnusium bicolor TaxID=1586634 RepID=A0AAV8ZBD3_9CUCU|nr:hypothetical protein NQ314_005907 [Rhamnusium bicolor]
MIYLLVRSKKGKDVQSRLNELFEDVVFERLRNEYPDFREKLVIIEGNCALPDLGLCVNIVFHVAATVRFDEKIKTAVAINIRATRDLLTLAHQMPKLKSFIHVSTLYSNCDKEVIEEKLYPAALDYNCLIRMTESVPEEILEKITPA